MLDKINVRIAMAQEEARKLEAKREAAEKESLRQEGARDGLKLASKRLVELMAVVDKEYDESGTISGKKIEELNEEPLRMMAAVKLWIQRSLGCVDNLATTAEVAMLTTNGKVKGLTDAIAEMKRAYDEEMNKLNQIKQGMQDGTFVVENGEVVRTTPIDRENPRMVGEHPGLTLKMQRQNEERLEEGKAPPSKKRGRPKKDKN